jgi:hypothetical protein
MGGAWSTNNPMRMNGMEMIDGWMSYHTRFIVSPLSIASKKMSPLLGGMSSEFIVPVMSETNRAGRKIGNIDLVKCGEPILMTSGFTFLLIFERARKRENLAKTKSDTYQLSKARSTK